MPADYIPSTDGKLISWANNFAQSIDEAGPAVGLSAATITASKNSCSNMSNAIIAHAEAKATARAAKAAKDAAIKAGKKQLRAVAKSVKGSLSYTSGIGAQLGILGHYQHNLDSKTYKPRIKAILDGGFVAVKFYKKGVQGVNLYTRLSGETVWQKLSFASRSPYIDRRPLAVPNQPEAREYMAIGVIADVQFGQESAGVEIVYGGLAV